MIMQHSPIGDGVCCIACGTPKWHVGGVGRGPHSQQSGRHTPGTLQATLHVHVLALSHCITQGAHIQAFVLSHDVIISCHTLS